MSQISQKLIAQKANIAQSEVSRVLNNKPTWLSDEKRRRIEKIAKELNYQPNHFAKSLKTGKANSIGIMPGVGSYLSPTVPYVCEIYHGIDVFFRESFSVP